MNLTKKELRERILYCRSLLSKEEVIERSEKIKESLLVLPLLKSYENIFIYVSDDRGEVETKAIIYSLFQEKKNVWIPRVIGNDLKWYHVDDGKMQSLQKNLWGIEEPQMDWEPNTDKVLERTVCIVPGIVFDRRGYRIGHGKGFFDRFLSKNRRCITVGLCYSFQMVMLCPHQEWDVPVDWVITENHIFHPHNSLT